MELEENLYMLELNLQFFADGGSGEKTEEPTEKRKREAREKGEVAKSIELNTALIVIFSFFAIKIFASYMYKEIIKFINVIYIEISSVENWYNRRYALKGLSKLLINILKIGGPIVLVCYVIAAVSNIIQVGWKPSLKTLKFNVGRLNPLKGFKNSFMSMEPFIKLIKSLAKVTLIVVVLIGSLKKEVKALPEFFKLNVMQSTAYVGKVIINIGIKIGIIFLVIALFDYLYQRHKHMKRLKMTKQEIKQEYKEQEGSPEIKSKLKQKRREMSMSSMVKEIPKADVIITNPTHYAIAIRYNQMTDAVPIVLAKGMNFMAKKIKEIAKENDIEIVENKPLARTLYAVVDIGDEIPKELYSAVAEILRYVYDLKNENE